MIQLEAILRGVIFIPPKSGAGLAQQEALCGLCANKHDAPPEGAAVRLLRGSAQVAGFFLPEIAIVLLLINPPCKSTLKEGQGFIHQRLPLKAALLSLRLPPDAFCFPGDSTLSRNCFQSSVGRNTGMGLRFGCFHTASL